jgi:hypothetical protein
MKPSLILMFLLPLLAGCATARYTEFPALSAWPITESAIADTNYATPAYRAWPPRLYRVVGSIQTAGRRHEWKPPEIARVAHLAKSRGGDAVILRDGSQWDAIGHAAALRHVVLPSRTAALVIKWKPEAEVDETVHRLDGFRAYLRRSYPSLHLESKEDLWKLGMEYITWLGLEIDSQRGTAELEKTLTSLVAPSTDSASSKWLFRGTIRENAASAETAVWGIATVTHDGENVAIFSDDGNVRVTFCGAGERLIGDFGLSTGEASLMARAEGTIEHDTIVLNAGAQTVHGPISVTFVFLR